MTNSKSNSSKKRFVLLTILLILISPWIWYLLFKFGVRTHEFHFLSIGIVALLIGIFQVRMKGSFWVMFILLLALPPVAQDLESFIVFEIHYANNDVHIPPSSFMPEGEMYRDFDSFYDFSYGYDDDSFRHRVLQHVKNLLIWLIVPLAYIFIQRNRRKPNHPSNLIDQLPKH